VSEGYGVSRQCLATAASPEVNRERGDVPCTCTGDATNYA
jgi:hypothetical protein